MPKLHVGVVTCSAEGAALCSALFPGRPELGGPHNHAEIPMHSHPLAEYVNCICANDWAGVAERMLSSSQKPWKTERLMDSRLACAAERGLGVS